MEYNILAVGEVLYDIIDGTPKLGGAPFNVAAHMARLGNRSFILSAVGKDELGNQIIQEADELKVHTEFIHRSKDKPTGTVIVEFKDGEPDYEIIQDVAWDYLKADFKKLEEKKWSVIALGSLAQRSEHNLSFYQEMFDNLTAEWIYFDCNLRQNFYSRSIIENSLHFANIGKFNEFEILVVSRLLYGKTLTPQKFAEKLNIDYGIELAVYTWGKEGSKAWYDGNMYDMPANEVKTKDSVGAGDAFSAGFLHSWIHGKTVEESLRNGNQLGGYVASHSGAIPVYNEAIQAYFNWQE